MCFLLNKQVIDLILPVIEKVKRNSVALLLIGLQRQKAVPPVSRRRRRQMALFPEEGKGFFRKTGELAQRESQPEQLPLLKIKGCKRDHSNVFSKITLALSKRCLNGGSKFGMQEQE